MRILGSSLFVCFGMLFIVFGDPSLKSLKRVKRIFNGIPVIGRNMGYRSVRYFAAVGTLHDRTFPLRWFKTAAGSWSSGSVLCGGALITMKIVQTACHCLAEFEPESGFIKKYVIRHPVVKSAWEAAYVIYLGINEERENVEGTDGMTSENAVKTRKFVVHQSCGKLGAITQGANTHDFGWITLDGNWWANQKIPISGVDFAPLYAEPELRRLYSYFFKNLPVCLHLGFGRQQDGTIPERMLYGWGVVLDRAECLKITSYNIPEDEIPKVWSWFCSYEFPGHSQKTGHGDSGGPIACNECYFGVVEGSSYHEVFENGHWVKHNYTVASQITYALFENAFEYRSDFISIMEDYSVVLYAEIIVHPTFSPQRSPQKHHFYIAQGSRSSCPSQVSSIFLPGFALLLRGLTKVVFQWDGVYYAK